MTVKETRGAKAAMGPKDIYPMFTDPSLEKLKARVIPWDRLSHEMGMPSSYWKKKP